MDFTHPIKVDIGRLVIKMSITCIYERFNKNVRTKKLNKKIEKGQIVHAGSSKTKLEESILNYIN